MQDLTSKSWPSAPLLRRSFQHLPGISAAKEAKLRSEGLRDWNDLLLRTTVQPDLFRKRGGELGGAVEASEQALANRDIEFFKNRLPKREFYRIAASFPERCVFLDIESTGLSKHYDHVTLVGWSVGSRYEVLIDPTDTSQLERELSARPVVITFNGTLFDLPFLTNRFNSDWSGATHVDLRYLARRVGLTGGQKKIEVTIGFAREAPLEGISGAEAVGLWFDYKEGDLSALRKLIRYNHTDIEGMKFLFERVVERLEPGTSADSANGGLFERSSVHFADNPGETIANTVRVSPYGGRVGPRLSFSDLRKRAAQLDSIPIVGIDLTGSEKRKSGWAAVVGQELTTELVASDADLIGRTLSAKPFLVSIDSPLSLPSGLIESIERNGSLTQDEALDAVRAATLDWHAMQTGKPVDRGLSEYGVLRKRRAPGNTCMGACARGATGTPEKPINDSKGCGGVMRVAPVGLCLELSDEEAFELAARCAAQTHGHPSGYLSAGALAAIVRNLIDGLEPDRCAARAVELARRWDGADESIAAFERAHELASAGSAHGPRIPAQLGKGWVGEEALAIAWYSVLVANDFADAMRMAANHDGDSDSTASIAGQVYGAWKGLYELPHGWIRRLDALEPLADVAGRVLAARGEG